MILNGERYITLEQFQKETGIKKATVRGYIKNGVWISGQQYVKPAGLILIDREGYHSMGRGGTGVWKASETSIGISFTYRKIRCRPRIKLKPTSANMMRAERHRALIIESIQLGTFDYAATFPDCPKRFQFANYQGQVITVGEALEEWLVDFKHLVDAGKRSTSTYINNRKIVLNKLIPYFGDYILSDLDRVTIKHWAESLDVSAKTLSNNLSPLKQVFQNSLDNGVIEHNPMQNWTYKNNFAKGKVSDVNPFNAEEQNAILSALRGQERNLIQFAFWTGLRTSELTALDWSDINLVRGEVSVNKAFTQAASEVEGTKTPTSIRIVKILPQALIALNAQKKHTFLKGKEVFQNPRYGERWSGDQPIRKTAWTPALKKAGVDYRRPYQTRHTYASMMLTADEPLAWVSNQLGHASILITAKIYAKYIKDSHPDAGMKADLLFSINSK